jgi:hypothetical protein
MLALRLRVLKCTNDISAMLRSVARWRVEYSNESEYNAFSNGKRAHRDALATTCDHCFKVQS